ncbi:MAG: sigma-70 family RNA polymerase sigma factor [Gemmatimonadaceae bacterium]
MTDNSREPSNAVTQLLSDAQRGSTTALNELLPLIYAELREIAARHMYGERPDHTLQPTALVNEAFLRLVGGKPIAFESRSHFICAASRAMRHVLVDHANARNATKRSGSLRVTLDEQLVSQPNVDVDMLVLDDALTRLAAADSRCAQVVELRFFGGLTVDEVAETLAISPATVKRDWQFARRWLATELGNSVADES